MKLIIDRLLLKHLFFHMNRIEVVHIIVVLIVFLPNNVVGWDNVLILSIFSNKNPCVYNLLFNTKIESSDGKMWKHVANRTNCLQLTGNVNFKFKAAKFTSTIGKKIYKYAKSTRCLRW